MAVGASYPETGGVNESAVHWDMICDLRQGGKIEVDGELLQEDGKFVVWLEFLTPRSTLSRRIGEPARMKNQSPSTISARITEATITASITVVPCGRRLVAHALQPGGAHRGDRVAAGDRLM